MNTSSAITKILLVIIFNIYFLLLEKLVNMFRFSLSAISLLDSFDNSVMASIVSQLVGIKKKAALIYNSLRK